MHPFKHVEQSHFAHATALWVKRITRQDNLHWAAMESIAASVFFAFG
jgi:hypothetical protein